MVRRAVHTRPICAAVRSLVERLEDRQLLSSGQLLPSYGSAGTLVLPDNLVDRGAVVTTTLGDSVFVGMDNEVTKLTPAGQPDNSFGVGGVFTLPAGTVGFISALAVQSDGKLLLTLRNDPSTDAQIMRLMPNGQPDSTWGNRGIIIFDFTLLAAQAQNTVTSVPSSVLVQPDGKVLVGGMEFAQGDAASSDALARFNPDGTPDLAFGTNGTALFLPANYVQNIVTTMRLQSDGQIAVLSSGAFADGSGGQLVNFILSRFSADGIVDGTFGGGNGFVAGPTDTIHNLVPVGFEIDSTGRFVVAANQSADPTPAPTPVGGYLLRYLNDGTQDTLFGVFGNNGIVTLPAGLSTAGISALALASDNSIVVGTGDWFRIAGFTADGLVDANIPTTVLVNPPAGQTARVDRVVFADSGALFAVGAIADAANPGGPTARIALARFVGEFNNAPIINLTGPTTVAEDQTVTFTYTTRVFGNNTITGYQWDYAYDGITFVPDATGPNPTILPGHWFAPDIHDVAARIVDSSGKTSAISEIFIAVTNVAPVASISLAGPRAIRTVPTTINLSAVNYPAGSIAYWHIDWGDGLVDVIPGNPSAAVHTYATAGTYTIQASATDNLNATSDIQSLDVNVLAFPQIAGTVFDDANRDGIQTGGETGIAGVQVFLDTNNNGALDAGEPVTTTDADGYYQFAGLAAGIYHVAIVKPDALFYSAPANGRSDASVFAVNATTTTNFGLADYYVVTGTVFADSNGNGVQDAGEVGLAGAVIYADTNNNGILDPGEASTVSSSDGTFTLTPVQQANTVIRAIPPAGFILTSNQNGTTTLPALFGAQGQAPVIGSVFEDRNADGLRALNDPGVSGVTVYVDINNNNVPDAGDIIATTDSAGMFSLPNVPPGTWSVRAVAPSGYHFGTAGLSSTVITRTLNAPIYGLSFPMLRNNTITGVVFNDTNADGVRNASEKPLSGVTVFLDTNGNGVRDPGEPVAFTNSTGRYTFSNVATVQGQHIGVVSPAGYRLTTDLSQPLPAVGSGQSFLQDIGLTQRISVSGGVFSDANRNGYWDLNEAGIRGFRVYIDTNGNGVFDANEPSVITDSQGRFAFNNLLPGTYTFRVVPIAGWQRTTPAGGAFTLTVKAGQMVQKRNFGFVKVKAKSVK
ncbi:MAG: SdrD B-like domain-containing protein [Tepidisphaerales bacterium]